MTIEIGAQWLIGAEQNPLISLLNLANVRRAKEFHTIVPRVLEVFINQSVCRDENNTMPFYCISRGCTYDDVSLGTLENLISYLSSQASSGLCTTVVKTKAKVTKIITDILKNKLSKRFLTNFIFFYNSFLDILLERFLFATLQ